MAEVLLQTFKLTAAPKDRRIKIGIAFDAAHLANTLSVLTMSIIVYDAIDPKTGKKAVSHLFPFFFFFSACLTFQRNYDTYKISREISCLRCSQLSRKRQKQSSFCCCSF
jgi:hypothetical protein